MKARFSDLPEKLTVAQLVSRQAPWEAMTGVYLQCSKDLSFLKATNGQTVEICIIVGSRVEEEGSLLITDEMGRVIPTMKKGKGAIIDIEVDDDVRISNERTQVMYTKPEQPPLWAFTIDESKGILLPAGALRSAVDYVASSAGSDSPYDTIAFHFGRNKVTIGATDTRRVSIAEIDANCPTPMQGIIYLPARITASLFSKALRGEQVEIVVYPRHNDIMGEFPGKMVVRCADYSMCLSGASSPNPSLQVQQNGDKYSIGGLELPDVVKTAASVDPQIHFNPSAGIKSYSLHGTFVEDFNIGDHDAEYILLASHLMNALPGATHVGPGEFGGRELFVLYGDSKYTVLVPMSQEY